MDRIEIRVDDSTKQEECGFFSFLFFLSGVYGFLFLLRSVEGIRYSGGVYLAAALFNAGLWYFRTRRRKLFRAGVALSVLCCLLSAFLLRGGFRTQLLYISDCLRGKEGLEAVPVTGIVLLFMVFLSLTLFFFEFVAGIHLICYLFVTLLLLASPILNIKISPGNLFFILFFQLGFCASGKSRRDAAVLLAVFFALAEIAVSCYSHELYAAAFHIEGFVYRTVQRLSGGEDKSGREGMVSRGNNYHTNTLHLELSASSKPSETLYLSGFTGGDYAGGTWDGSDDGDLFERMEETLDWQQWGYMIGGLYESMYFVLNQNRATGEEAEPITLTIRHMDGNYKTVYAPYYRRKSRGWGQSAYFNPVNSRAAGREDGYTYLYFEQKDMYIDWGNLEENFKEPGNWYYEIQAAYMEEAQSVYTQVPTGLLPGFQKLVEEHPLADEEEITAFIRSTLHSNASYSLTPGWAPMNKDIAEYFLFERKSGYCVHFATAATLLYRLYGIPARYVSGYMVQPSAFSMREDGSFHANVTDGQAHAWVEIFQPEYGWMPVEMTPSSGANASVSYPRKESAGWEGHFRDEGENREENRDSDEPGDERLYTGVEDEPVGWFAKFTICFQTYRDAVLIFGVCLGYSIVLLPFFFDYWKLRKSRKMEEMTSRMIFARLLKLLHDCGRLSDMDGSEPDFVKRVADLSPELLETEVSEFMESVSAASYGPEKAERHKDVERALWVYRSVEQAIHKR